MQPEDVLPGDIDANPGAPWIPETNIRDFAATLFGRSSDTVSINHLRTNAVGVNLNREWHGDGFTMVQINSSLSERLPIGQLVDRLDTRERSASRGRIRH